MKTAEEIFAMTKQFYAPQAIEQLNEWKHEIQQDARYQALSEAAEVVLKTEVSDMRPTETNTSWYLRILDSVERRSERTAAESTLADTKNL